MKISKEKGENGEQLWIRRIVPVLCPYHVVFDARLRMAGVGNSAIGDDWLRSTSGSI